MTDSAEAVLHDGTVIPITIRGKVRIGAPLADHERELTAAGWDVQELPGLDHPGAMQSSVVVPLLRTWLDRVAGE